MARMKVYHPTSGEVYEGEPIDCREMVQLHGYLRELPKPATIEAPTPPTTESLPEDLSTLTKTRLQEILTERGVVFETDANKSRLIELLTASQEK